MINSVSWCGCLFPHFLTDLLEPIRDLKKIGFHIYSPKPFPVPQNRGVVLFRDKVEPLQAILHIIVAASNTGTNIAGRTVGTQIGSKIRRDNRLHIQNAIERSLFGCLE